MQFKFQNDLSDFLVQQFQCESFPLAVELCPPEFSGDLTVSCFPLAKALRRNPMQLAVQVSEFLTGHEDILKSEAVKAFVNLTLRPAALMRDSIADQSRLLVSCLLPEAERQRILIEFSAPNTNKPQHLGHVRNNTVGMATASILERAGHQVIRVNLVNDRGIHICKSMLAYQRFGNGITPEKASQKGDHLVGDFYVRFDQEFRRQIAELKASNPALANQDDDELFLETEIGRAAQMMLQKWEQDDPEVRQLWQTMNQWVFDGFEQTYQRMGVTFERTYLESQTYALGRDIILKGLENKLFKRRDDGAVSVRR